MFAFRSIYSNLRTRFTKSHKIQIRESSFYRRGFVILFQKNLMLTNSITSGLCMFLGDLAQQELEYQTKIISKRYDWERSVRMLIVGIGLGPLHHYYYVYLDKILPKVNFKNVFTKILADQAIASPLTILGFFYGMGMLEKKTLNEISNETKNKFLYVYLGDCLYWPPIQFINFYYLPTHYRVIYINVATMVFNTFLSYMKHFDQHSNKDIEHNVKTCDNDLSK